ncbi:MAG: phosphate ABC transporter permease PstA [Roseiflexaceae bacterium]|nr:phosphate ABC transporter permease PstA [Roseiflexaceae bacterium]
MSSEPRKFDIIPAGQLPDGEALQRNVAGRRTSGTVWRNLFLACILVALISLVLVAYNVANDAYGLVATQSRLDETELTGGVELEQLEQGQLLAILQENLRSARLRAIEREQPLAERSQEGLVELIQVEILRQEIIATNPLVDSLFNRTAFEERVLAENPRADIEWKRWFNVDFIRSPGSSRPEIAGISTAIWGSLGIILVTMLVALPLGIGAAIYLEEYAGDSRISRIIQTNISNLAGVPSIIYGMLGLAIFVRALGAITSGALFGYAGADPAAGRSILSGGLTMALLILPIIVITTQEAIRAVPRSLRQASLALGATKWQTIWNQVLPISFPGILTGTILAVSRAMGETAPLVVLGTATYIAASPDSIFSRYTTLPIQIYQWTSRPQAEFRNLAAATIIMLLIIILLLNATAILLRNRYSKRLN